MIVMIDNFDSFTYNLYQLLGEINPDIRVYRNNSLTVEQVKNLKPDHIVISPGPGFPASAGISMDVIRQLGSEIPVLGVCLGHQAIGQVYGGRVVHAPQLMHGKVSQIRVDRNCPLFDGLPETIPAGRYHSLIIEPEGLPQELMVTAWGPEGEVMGVKHRQYPVYGIQFHPESILTPDGRRILQNFLNL